MRGKNDDFIMRNMDLASKKYWDLSNLSILKHEKRS
jgi:hypothetical protein